MGPRPLTLPRDWEEEHLAALRPLRCWLLDLVLHDRQDVDCPLA